MINYKVFSNFNAEIMVLSELLTSPQAHQDLDEDDFSLSETKAIYNRIRMFNNAINTEEFKACSGDLNDNIVSLLFKMTNNNPEYWLDELMKTSFLRKLRKMGRQDIIDQFVEIEEQDGDKNVIPNELFTNHTTLELQEYLKKQFDEITKAFKVYDGIEPINFDEEDKTEVEAIVDGMFYNGSINAIIGQSKVGKSFLAHQLAYCVQNGYKFMNHDTKKCDVAVFDFEQTEKIVKQKMKSVKDEYGEGDIYQAFAVAGKVFSIDSIVEKIRLMKMRNPNLGMVILDCYYSFAKGDENKAEDVMKSLMPLTRIKDDLCIVYLHHTNKSGGKNVDLINASSGSGFHGRFCDQTLVVSKDKDEYELGIAGRVWYGEKIIASKTETGLYKFEESYTGQKPSERNKLGGKKIITNEELEAEYPEICKLIGEDGVFFGTISKQFDIDKNTLKSYGFKISPKDKNKFKEFAEKGLKTEYVLMPNNKFGF